MLPFLPLEAPTGDAVPRRPEQAEALREILYGVGALDEDEIEGLANEAWRRLKSPCAFPSPQKLARACGFSLHPQAHLPLPGLFLPPRSVLYRRDHDVRAEGWVVYHEVAHGLAPVSANHADIVRLGLALTIPRADVLALVRTRGAAGAKRVVCARHKHVPVLFLRLRIERVLLAAKAA